MKTLKVNSVQSIYTQTLKDGSSREKVAVSLEDGNVAHLNSDYLAKKCKLIGITLNDFLGSAEDYQLVASNADTTMVLRKEGVEFSYEDADGKVQSATPKSTYWDIRGSFNIKMSDKAKLMRNASASLADRLIADLGIDFGSIANTAKAEVEQEVTETEPTIVD